MNADSRGNQLPAFATATENWSHITNQELFINGKFINA